MHLITTSLECSEIPQRLKYPHAVDLFEKYGCDRLLRALRPV
jgi:hypothetical protein